MVGSALSAKAALIFGVRRTALLGGVLVAGGSMAIALWSKTPWLPLILGTLTKVLQVEGHRWGVAAICIGVGQGLAVVLENVT